MLLPALHPTSVLSLDRSIGYRTLYCPLCSPSGCSHLGLLGAALSLGQGAVWGNPQSTVSGCFRFLLSQGMPMTSHWCVHWSGSWRARKQTWGGDGHSKPDEALPVSAHGGGLIPAITAESDVCDVEGTR